MKTVKIPVRTHEELKKLKEKSGISITRITENAIKHEIQNYEEKNESDTEKE